MVPSLQVEKPIAITLSGTANQGMQWYIDAIRWFDVYPETKDINNQLLWTVEYTTGWPTAYVEQSQEAKQLLAARKETESWCLALYSLVRHHNSIRTELDSYALSPEYQACITRISSENQKLHETVKRDANHIARIDLTISPVRPYPSESNKPDRLVTVYPITATGAVLSSRVSAEGVAWVKRRCENVRKIFGPDKIYTFTIQAMTPKKRGKGHYDYSSDRYASDSMHFLAELEETEHKFQQLQGALDMVIVRTALSTFRNLRQIHENQIRNYNEEQRRYNQHLLEFEQKWVKP